jgi:hypothetical protein
VRSFVVALLLVTSSAYAEPVHIRSASTVTTRGGSTLQLPPGYFLDEDLWKKLDNEVKRLQDAETRLTAENKELKRTANGATWSLVLGALVVGTVVGAAAW